jgi:hypothetical protein
MSPMVRQAHHEAKPLKTRGLILSLSKDEAKISCFFSGLLGLAAGVGKPIEKIGRLFV